MIVRLLGHSQLARPVAEGATPSALLSGGKPLALVAYLLAAPGRAATRDQLIDLLWSDVDHESARHTLRQTLWYLRKKGGPELVVGSGEIVRVGLSVESDRQRFLDHLDTGDVEAAIDEYGGDFFPDFASPGAAAFEQWADIERQRLQGLFVSAVTSVVQGRLQNGRAREALAIARSAKPRAPQAQALARLIIESLVAAGEGATARIEAEHLQRQLEQEEADPDPPTTALLRRVLNGSQPEPLASTPGEDGRLTTDLVGRDSAFATLLRAFDRARRGSPLHVHISAAAGFGKTRLLDGLASRLKASRARVVSVRAVPAERSIPFAFASQLAGALVALRGAAALSPEAASTLVDLTPSASSYLSASPARLTADEAPRRRTLALVELLAAVAEDSAVVVLVDDVHWMDAASRQMLAAAAERVESGKLLLVTTARPVDRFAELTTSAEVLTLDPLSVDDVTSLLSSVAAMTDATWAELLPGRLQSATAGSPLLIIETLQLALERGLLCIVEGRWTCPEPADLLAMLGGGRAIQQRLSALPAGASDALLAMAIVGEPVTDDALAHILGAADVRSATSLLETRGLTTRVLDAWRPAHDEIAALVVDLASAPVRASMHRAAAAWLEAHPSGERASQLTRATWHRWRADDQPGLARCFTRLVEQTRLAGLATPAAVLARDALGPDAAREAVEALVGMLPRRLATRRWRSIGILVGLASAAVIAAVLFREASPAPVDAAEGVSLIARVRDSDGRTRWVRGYFDPLRLSPALPPAMMPVAPPFRDDALESIGALSGIVGERLFADHFRTDAPDRAVDLVEILPDGRLLPVDSKPHDQFIPTLSPDRSQLAYLDRDFSETQTTEVVVRSLVSGTSTRLTQTAASEVSLSWSPDGSELAFIRAFRDTTPYEVCRLRIRDGREQCEPAPSEFVPQALRAWRLDGTLLIEAISRRTGLVALVAWDDRTRTRLVDEGGRSYISAPQGELVLCQCRIQGVDRPVLTAFSYANPKLKVAITVDGAYLDAVTPLIALWGRERNVVQRTAIDAPDSVMVGETALMQVRAFNAEGRVVPMPYRRWRSDSPRIATVDSAGVVSSHAPGVARIFVETLGGLRDSVALRVVNQAATRVFREDWQKGIAPRWYAVGVPSPTLAGADSARRLRLNGDEVLTSGVISRDARLPTRGMGVRVRFRLPISESVWQSLGVSLDPVADDAELQRWIRTPSAPSPTWPWRGDRTCHMRLPSQEGGAFRDLVALVGAGELAPRTAMPPAFGDGAEHELSIQVFADGRCGYALDGVTLGRSVRPIVMDRPLRVVVEGQSVRTTVEVLSIEWWEGVRAERSPSPRP